MDIRNSADLAAVVREQRRRLGITQKTLADRAGVGAKFIVRLEQGHPALELGRALAVLEALDLALTVADGSRDVDVDDSASLLDAVFDSLDGGQDHG